MAHYLLPCECGRKLDVSTADAGEQMTCPCGRKVDVPTLRGLEALEPAASSPSSTAQRAWSGRQGVAFLGASLIVVAGVGLIALLCAQPPTAEQLLMRVKRAEHVDVDKLPPAEAWLRWNEIEQGLMRLTVPEVETLKYARTLSDNWRIWRTIAYAAGGLGIALIFASFLIPRRRSVRAAQKPATATRH